MDWYIVFATIAGPILAVQAQKVVESLRQSRTRKLQIFKILMATRAARLSPEHVQALNMLDIDFYGSKLLGLFRYQSRKDKKVTSAWRVYLDSLNENTENASEAVLTEWNVRTLNHFIELLSALSIALGYDFDTVHLKNGLYSPRAHGKAESEHAIIRGNLAKILSGQQSIPMAITHVPHSKESVDLQREIQVALLSSLKGETPLKVSLHSSVSENHELG